MAKRKKPADSDGSKKEPYPSRKNTRYVALPLPLYKALDAYRISKSDEDEEKSMSWAARVAVRKFLTDIGFWPPPAPG